MIDCLSIVIEDNKSSNELFPRDWTGFYLSINQVINANKMIAINYLYEGAILQAIKTIYRPSEEVVTYLKRTPRVWLWDVKMSKFTGTEASRDRIIEEELVPFLNILQRQLKHDFNFDINAPVN